MNGHAGGLYCQVLADLIVECDASNPDPAALSRIERHIAECDVCQGAESVLSSTVTRFRLHEPAGVSERFQEEVVSRLCGGGSAGPKDQHQD